MGDILIIILNSAILVFVIAHFISTFLQRLYYNTNKEYKESNYALEGVNDYYQKNLDKIRSYHNESSQATDPSTQAFAVARIEDIEDHEPLLLDAGHKLLAGILRKRPEGVTAQRFHLPDVEEVEMEVVIRASGFEISPDWHQRVKVVRGQDSDLLEFILVPKETGEKKIEVEFLYKRHWLTAIVLDVTVVASNGGGV